MSEKLPIYHTASVEDIPGILNEGITPSDESYRHAMESDLQLLADDEDISLPVKRQECVFCYPSLRQAIDMASFETGPAGSLDALFSRQGLLIIDGTSLRDELYVADFTLFTEIIELRYGAGQHAIIQSESYEAALRNYAESMTSFEAFDSVSEIHDEFRIPELLIESDISPTDIRETLLCKEILGTGWFSSYPELPVGE
jgi:hypothetical protein